MVVVRGSFGVASDGPRSRGELKYDAKDNYQHALIEGRGLTRNCASVDQLSMLRHATTAMGIKLVDQKRKVSQRVDSRSEFAPNLQVLNAGLKTQGINPQPQLSI
jgi:hypothetical protein